jgi:hypothetical protein
MKKWLVASFFLILIAFPAAKAAAQVQQLEQLALDVEKLAQMKSILTEMYTGYKILTTGYDQVKSLAEGNFNLHNAFLNSLLAVSPNVKSYVRVADIISAQLTLISQYKSALSAFNGSGAFSVDELNYMSQVYGNLVDRSIDNLDELAMILTDNQLRMSDAERLSAIDHIYSDMQGKVNFLSQFNNQAGMLANQRQAKQQEYGTLQNLFGQ